ncbi:hypothetical protein KVR01_008290 [Diaporthe batatas]|uniref:uncharacterized protein n=1 Tax=Diaporthe batatas TaxID=748121 RepID=UPI001D04B9E4|nr:uncharacterized protein KVR01_008290 [Diaporthe batatas]KAG8162525.1 hypothetical protein KVR01_008290 [Diaporthe batatas]
MASRNTFQGTPPFPDDIPTASMSTISLATLRSGGEEAAKSLLAACRELGFFQLDLDGDVLGLEMMKDIDQLFVVGKVIMNLPSAVKTQYLHDAPRSFLGFKPRGGAKTETDEPDRFEWLNLGQDSLMGASAQQPVPPLVQSHLALFTSFLKHGQSIVATISSTIATQLGLPPDTFASLQDPSKPSGTVIRLIKAFASPDPTDLRTSMIHHTDFGTITLLANVLGGLQILAPGKSPGDDSGWLWVRPRPGFLVVNLGDAMVQWTGGLLRSNVHRIRYAPGAQRFHDRFSLALLVRPERNASMRRLIGEEQEDEEEKALTAWEWEVKKTMSYTRGEAVAESKGGKQWVQKA